MKLVLKILILVLVLLLVFLVARSDMKASWLPASLATAGPWAGFILALLGGAAALLAFKRRLDTGRLARLADEVLAKARTEAEAVRREAREKLSQAERLEQKLKDRFQRREVQLRQTYARREGLLKKELADLRAQKVELKETVGKLFAELKRKREGS